MKGRGCWKLKKEDVRHYDSVAAVYDAQYREEQEAKYSVVLNSICASRRGCILDLGCGTGLFVKEAAALGDYVGVDHSWKMLKKAKQKRGGQRVFFLCADADNLPFADGVFDVVFSFTVLQNVPSSERTVAEIRRVSKRGSEVVLSVSKKAFTHASFLRVLAGSELLLVRLIDGGELKDYVAICENARDG